jgi:1-acyl-sn-glycerol-3-phosphate acyltransferase
MTLASRTVNFTIKNITRMLCRIYDSPLAQIPYRGPLILVVNHINFLDIPVLYTHLQPRPVTGLVKSETWDNPAMAYLFNLWGGIPVRRGEADMEAMHLALAALRQGKIVAIAPEGTRSGHGRLQLGQPGLVTLGLHSRAPLLPVVYYGNEAFRSNFTRLRRTDFYFKVGQPFYIHTGEQKANRAVRQAITAEIMYQLAGLLPPEYRGCYADMSAATQKYLQFCTPGSLTPAAIPPDLQTTPLA